MKKFTLFVAITAISAITFAQSCPSSLKRSNGNGVCNGMGQLTLSYPTCPSSVDYIDSVWVDGVKYNVTFGPPSACSGPQNQISYCIIGGNMPPTGFWRIFFHNITVIGGFNCLVPDGGPLPIDLTGFYAKRIFNNVTLNWQTAFEQNAKSFEIQRNNGNEWVTVATVNASNSASGSSYSFTDKNTNTGISQYRLKMIDLDLNFRNSEIRSVKGMGISSEFTVYPNPSNGDARVTLSDISEGTEVMVLDNAGRMVKRASMENTNTIDFKNLQKGMYMIRVTNKNTGEAATKKLTVIN